MKFSTKILHKVITPITERLLNATYGVYSTHCSGDPIDFDEWCAEVKNVLNYDTSVGSPSPTDSLEG